MYHFFQYRRDPYVPSKYLVNPVRCVEAVLCFACLVIAIFMIITLTYMSVFVKVTLAVVASTFAMITTIDIISNCYRNPIFWNTWLLFALSGALLFFLCVGLLVATYTGIIVILLIGEIFNAVTAIIFLLEAILILNILRKHQSEVSPYKDTIQSEASPYKDPSKSEVSPYKDPSKSEVSPYKDTRESEVSPYKDTRKSEVSPYKDIRKSEVSSSKDRINQQAAKPSNVIIHGPPSQPHLVSEPNRTRSSISYGGTFPMGKNEAPLPSPEKTMSVTRTSSKRRTNITRSASQTLTTVSSAKLRRGSDGRMYLADGTPLTEVHLPNGDVEYRNANGVAYTRDGIPIFRESSMHITEPLPKKEIQGYCDPSCASKPLPNKEIQEYREPSYGSPPPAPVTVPSNQIEIFRESSRQHVTSQGVVYRDGEWWTRDGRLVPKVHVGPNGKLMRDDKTPLYEIVVDEGHMFHESADGFLYNQNGTPIGANADLESDISRYYEHEGHISKSGHHTPEKSNQQLLGLERPVVGRSEQDVGRLRGRSSQNYESKGGLRSRSQNIGGPSKSGLKTISETTIHEESIEEESIHEETGDSIRTRQVRESRSTDRTETIIQEDDKTGESLPDRNFRSNDLTRTVDSRQPQQPQQIAHTARAQRGRCMLYLSDGTPLTEVETASGHLLYQSSDGETFKREGNLVCPTYDDPKNVPPCSRCRKKQQHLVCRQGSPTPVKKVNHSMSRTVAVSTRMVPKNRKSSSASRSPNRCPVKSASKASYDQQPETVHRQVTHGVCRCAKKHMESTLSVQGTVSSTTSPPTNSPRRDTSPNIRRGSPSPSSSEQTALTNSPRRVTSPNIRRGSPSPSSSEQTALTNSPRRVTSPNIRRGSPSPSSSEQTALTNSPRRVTCPNIRRGSPSPSSAEQTALTNSPRRVTSPNIRRGSPSPSSSEQTSLTNSPRRVTCPNIRRGSPSPSSSEQTALTTISECECETDASSGGEASDGFGSQNMTYRSESLANRSMENRTGTDEVQTSETRIVTASDVQKMNTQDTTVRRK